MTGPPAPKHILELCLYVGNISKSVSFYRDILRLGAPFLDSPRVAAYSLGQTTLLLFQQGTTFADVELPSGTIPKHGQALEGGPPLRTHFALAADSNEHIREWRAHFERSKVPILGQVSWPRGGASIYFSDPDGHVGEIASKGIWPNY